nr:pseudouridine synthase [Paraphotobacterium marinum]
MIDKYETDFALQQIRDYCGKFVYPLHRLDKPTSGCLLFAFDKKVAIDISHQFTARTVKKNIYQ